MSKFFSQFEDMSPLCAAAMIVVFLLGAFYAAIVYGAIGFGLFMALSHPAELIEEPMVLLCVVWVAAVAVGGIWEKLSS